MKQVLLKILLLSSSVLYTTGILAEYVTDYNLHLYLTIDRDAKEACIGTGEDLTTANAIAYPPYGDEWWISQTNLWENLIIPNSITYQEEEYTITGIAPYAFYKCTRLKNVVLPETIRAIGTNAFAWCVNLESINIPNLLTTIQPYTFELCRKLQSVYLPEGILSVGANAFSDCQSLEEINIPGNCSFVGNDAFKWCTNLKRVIIEDGKSTLSLGCSYGVSIDYEGSDKPTQRGLWADCPLRYLYIGRNLSYDSDNNYYYSPLLTISNYCKPTASLRSKIGKSIRVEFGFTVTAIPDGLFWRCSLQTDFQLPQNLESIGNAAFSSESGTGGAFNSPSLILPSTLTRIGKNAFGNCANLHFIYSNSEMPPTVEIAPFSVGEVLVFVPQGCRNTYMSDNYWGQYNIVDSSEASLSINVRTPGTLYSRLIAQDVQIGEIQKLKLKGSINDDDWSVIMGMSALCFLDLSEISMEDFPANTNFQNTYIMDIKLPKNLKTIKAGLFNECKFLSGIVELPYTCKNIGNNAFAKTQINGVELPDSIKIESDAFWLCKNLKTIKIPSCAIVCSNAFNQSGIENATICTKSKLDNNAFYNNANFKEVVIEEGVDRIGNNALGYNVEKLTFEGLVKVIGSMNYSNLSEIYVKDINTWCSLPFNEIGIMGNAPNLYIGGCLAENIVIPSNIREIREYAFYNCKTIKQVHLPEKIHTISSYAFSGCSQLYDITLPPSLKNIGPSAFSGCSSLEELDIPQKVESIGENAFADNSNLKTVVVHWSEPVKINSGTFTNLPIDCYLYTPINTSTSYYKAGWSDFANMKEKGILNISTNLGGSISSDTYTISAGTHKIYFTPYKSFNIIFNMENDYYILMAKLDGINVTDEIENGMLYIEEPEKNLNLSVVFANDNISVGDGNGDGEIDSADVISIVNHILKQDGSVPYEYSADINEDGVVNVTDVIRLIAKLLKTNVNVEIIQ